MCACVCEYNIPYFQIDRLSAWMCIGGFQHNYESMKKERAWKAFLILSYAVTQPPFQRKGGVASPVASEGFIPCQITLPNGTNPSESFISQKKSLVGA